jgi:hypothetical protein
MLKNDYIVDCISGEVIWISSDIKQILRAYYMIKFDPEKKIYLFLPQRRNDIFKIIFYESGDVD